MSKDNSRLDAIIEYFLQSPESDSAAAREKLIAQNPDMVDELQSFFRNHDQMQQAVTADDATMPPSSKPVEDESRPPSANTGEDATIAPNSNEKDTVTLPPGGNEESATVGTKLRYFGDYELLEEIARGGMGVVYKARQTGLNRIVALKMILAGQLAGEEDVQRFHAEAEAAANLDHPGIVPIYEIGEHEGQHYFSMGYVEGQSLADKIKDGPLPPREAAESTMKVAEAVAFAHEHGVIHRDLKPANVLIDKNGEPKVTDFGLAKKVEGDSGLTATGQILGTPSYMPPEQAGGRTDEVREAADVYSLGAILYALLTARPPFQSDNHLDTLLQVLEQEPISPRRLNTRVPSDLETISLKSLEKSSAARYQSATEVRDELGRFLADEPILARPISRAARAWRVCKRNPVVSALTLAFVFALLSGTGVATYFAILANKRAVIADENAESFRQQKERADQNANEALAQKNRADAEAIEAIAQRDLAEERRYVTQLRLAQTEWNYGDPIVATRTLAQCQADLRSWEYGYLFARFHNPIQQIRVFNGHEEAVLCVALSPDGDLVASGSSDNTVCVFDRRTGKLKRRLKGHLNSVWNIAFSPDGKLFASGSWDKTIKLWNVETGQLKATLKGHSAGVQCLAFSPDGKQIASGGLDRTVKVWSVQMERQVINLAGHRTTVAGVAFSPDGMQLASASTDKTIKTWSLQSQRVNHTFKGHGGYVNSVSFAQDGQRIVSGSFDNTVRVWDTSTGQLRSTLKGHRDAVRDAKFTRDGEKILSCSRDGTIRVWDAKEGKTIHLLKGHTSSVTGAVLSNNEKHIVSGSADGTVRMWNATPLEDQNVTLRGHKSNVFGVATDTDGMRIASVSRAGTIKVWDTEMARESLSFAGHPRGPASVCFAGQLLVSAGADGLVKIWNATTGQLRKTLQHGGKSRGLKVMAVTASPDGKRIASIGLRKLKVWNTDSGEEIMTLDCKGFGVAFSPSGDRIVCDAGVWNIESREKLVSLDLGIGVKNYAFDREGKRIVAGRLDGKLDVWDVDTQEQIFRVKAHTGAIMAMTVSPDGRRIVTGGMDKRIKVWSIKNGEALLDLKDHDALVSSLAFSASGQLVSGSGDRTVKIWKYEDWK